MRIIYTRVFHKIAALLFYIGCLSCTSYETEQREKITIEFWTIALGDAFADYVNGMIRTYEDEHPEVQIKWVDVSGGEVSEKLLAALVGQTPPDVVNIYDLPRFLQFGVLADMDSLVSPEEQNKRFDNFWRGIGQYQGRNYVIPWYTGVSMLWYNKSLFERAGLDPDQPPKTIDEMLAMGQQIYERTGKYGVSWRLHPSLGTPPWALLHVDGFWPLFNEERSKTLINDPAAAAILQKWITAYQNGTIPPEALAASHRDDVNWFIEGRAAMFPFSGGWITRYFDQSFEQVAQPAAQPRGRLGSVPANSQAIVVPRMSDHVEQAVDFALFVTNDANQLEFCRQVAILPSTKKAAADPYFQREPVTLADHANLFSYKDIGKSIVITPPDVTGWSRMEDVLYEEFAKAMAGKQSIEQALQRVERKWNHLLDY
tara:strand:+ start:5459 stop:6742 length:1284 start_codon:yes stop_codon:yes gene_type:complete